LITTRDAVRCTNETCKKVNNVDGRKIKQTVKCKWCGTVFSAERKYYAKRGKS